MLSSFILLQRIHALPTIPASEHVGAGRRSITQMNDRNQFYQIPNEITERDGLFDEFKQDAAIVTIELLEGKKYGGVLVLYPNYIIGMEGDTKIPFAPSQIKRVYQTEKDRKMRTDDTWIIWDHPWNT